MTLTCIYKLWSHDVALECLGEGEGKGGASPPPGDHCTEVHLMAAQMCIQSQPASSESSGRYYTVYNYTVQYTERLTCIM